MEVNTLETSTIRQPDVERVSLFFSRLIHDTRGPVAGMLNVVDLLGDDLPDADRKSLILEMKLGIVSLLGALKNHSMLGKLLLGQIPAPTTPVDLAEIAAAVVDARKPMARDRNITLSFTWNKTVRGVFLGNSALLEFAIGELIDNALKFTPRHGEIRVALEFTPAPASIRRLSVSDTGPGLSPQEMEKLFKEFVRLTPRPLHGETSHGLGLSIVSEIARLHRGRAGADCLLGNGSNFFIELPA